MGEEVEDTEHPRCLEVHSLHGAREDAGSVKIYYERPGERMPLDPTIRVKAGYT